MFDYEIEIARRERLYPFYSYPYKVVPLFQRTRNSASMSVC